MTDQTEQAKQPENAGNSGDSASQGVKSYSQDELNRMFAERSSQAERSLFKKLGFENFEQAESTLKKAHERNESEKTELQRAQELAAEREKQIQGLQSAQKALATQNEVQLKAIKLGIVDPDAAYKLLNKEALEYGEDGKPTNAEALLVAMLKERPYLAGGSASAMNPAKFRDDADPFIQALLKGLPDKKR